MSTINDILRSAAGDNAMAFDWLCAWTQLAHDCDDLVDTQPDGEFKVRLMANLNALYSAPFYVMNAQRLQLVVMLTLNDYEDSVLWEKSEVDWQRKWADQLRFAGNHMVCAVAYLTGGWERMRYVSQRLRQASWETHHNEQGEAI